MKPKFVDVGSLPELIEPGEAEKYPQQRIFKFRIEIREGVLSIIGDSPHPRELEEMLQSLGFPEIQYVLCG